MKNEIENLRKKNEEILKLLDNIKVNTNFQIFELNNFETGKYLLSEEQETFLDKLVLNSELKEAYITGYCDFIGTEKRNLELGLYRAKEVAKYLKDKGFNIKQVKSFGNNSIIDLENLNNRRVEIMLK